MKPLTALNISLGLLACVASGLLVSDLLAHRLTKLFPARRAPAAAVRTVTPPEEPALYSVILEKGLFGRATQGKLTPIAAGPASRAPGQMPAAQAPADLVLLGTAIGSFRETFALVQKPATREERVIRLGEKVFDLGPLVSVGKEQIEVLVNGRKTVIRSPAEAGSAPPSPAGAPPAAHGGLATSMGGGNFVIDQRALNAALDNIGQAMSDARLLPAMKEGRVEGFRVSEVKPTGIFAMVGIRNGDTILRMNDFPIDSPEKAIQSLAALKGQTRLKVDVMRDGQPVTFTYDIR